MRTLCQLMNNINSVNWWINPSRIKVQITIEGDLLERVTNPVPAFPIVVIDPIISMCKDKLQIGESATCLLLVLELKKIVIPPDLVLFNYCFRHLNHLICGYVVKYQASTGQEFLFANSATITVGVKHLAKAEAARLNLRPSSPLPLVFGYAARSASKALSEDAIANLTKRGW